MIASTIELSEVTKTYGSTRAVDGVSVAFGRGVTGLLGPNGAGKTTLLRIIATVLAADSGTVSVLGEDPGEVSGRLSIRRRLGYFPQEPGYYDNLSAFDFVDYIAILKEMTERRAAPGRGTSSVDRGRPRRRDAQAHQDTVGRHASPCHRRPSVAGEPRVAGARRTSLWARPGTAAAVSRDRVRGRRAAHRVVVDAPDRRRGGTLSAGGRRRPRPNPPRRHTRLAGRAGAVVGCGSPTNPIPRRGFRGEPDRASIG